MAMDVLADGLWGDRVIGALHDEARDRHLRKVVAVVGQECHACEVARDVGVGSAEALLQLLAELGGVLDQTVGAAGLTSGSYLVLRELVARPEPRPITTLATDMGADPDEVATLCGRLVSAALATTGGCGAAAT